MAVTEGTIVHIRWMISRDLPEVLAIEKENFDCPWNEDKFLRYQRQRNCVSMVYEQAGRVVGFMVYELHKAKFHVVNLAVHPEVRRQGIGSQMVAKLVGKLRSHRWSRIVLEARERNVSAQLFLQHNGFCAFRVLREWYDDTGEDAYLMQYCLTADEKERAPAARRSA